MRSISSKSLVSKFTTAVRGVVFSSFAVLLLISDPNRPLHEISALANSTCNQAGAEAACAGETAGTNARQQCVNTFLASCARASTQAGTCQQWISNIQNAHERFMEACTRIGERSVQSCFRRADQCREAQSRMDAETGDDEDCDSTDASACPELYAGSSRDHREEQRQADQDRRDNQRQIQDLTKQLGDTQSELARKQMELRQDMEKAAMDFRKAERELMEQLKKTLDEIDAQQAQALDKAQEAYRAMDAEYVKMRDKLRRLQSNINRMRDGQLAQCRGAAQAKYQVAEEARLKARNQGPQNRGSMSSLAGDERRRAQRDMRSRQADYTAFYNECMAGQSPEGRAAQNNINKAQDELRDEEKLVADQSAMLEKQRLEIIQKLKQLEETAKVKKQEAHVRVQQQLQTLRETFEMNQRQNQERMQMAQQEAMQKQQNLQNQLGQAQQQSAQAAQAGNARARAQRCAGRAGRMSESEGQRRSEAVSSVPARFTTLRSLCRTPPRASNGQAENCGAAPAEFCTTDVLNFNPGSGGRTTR
jgi:hypothetical protein